MYNPGSSADVVFAVSSPEGLALGNTNLKAASRLMRISPRLCSWTRLHKQASIIALYVHYGAFGERVWPSSMWSPAPAFAVGYKVFCLNPGDLDLLPTSWYSNRITLWLVGVKCWPWTMEPAQIMFSPCTEGIRPLQMYRSSIAFSIWKILSGMILWLIWTNNLNLKFINYIKKENLSSHMYKCTHIHIYSPKCLMFSNWHVTLGSLNTFPNFNIN